MANNVEVYVLSSDSSDEEFKLSNKDTAMNAVPKSLKSLISSSRQVKTKKPSNSTTVNNLNNLYERSFMENDDLDDLMDIDEDSFCSSLEPVPSASNLDNLKWPLPELSSVSKSKKRSTAKEIAASSSKNTNIKIQNTENSATTTKSLEKEKNKREAEKIRELKKLEREEKNAAKEREKLIKKTEADIRRGAKPGEALKSMTVILDSKIGILKSITTFFDSSEVKYEISSESIIDNIILFKRELRLQAMGEDLNIIKISKWEDEDQAILFLESDAVVPKVYSQIQEGGGNCDEIDFISYIKSIQSIIDTKKLTLLIYGMDKYFKKLKKSSQKEFRDRVLNGQQQQDGNKRPKKKKAEELILTINEFQSAMIELQLATHISYRIIDSPVEVGKILLQYTKSIADAPYKRQMKEQGFDWYASADSAGSVKVEKDGKGLMLLWLEQLQLFSKVGIDAAQAIVKIYPSPSHLIEAYRKCSSTEAGLNLLQDINVRQGVGPLARDRKLGPDLSKKIYRFFTSTNGDRFLSSNQEF